MGFLAHEGAVFLKLSQEGIEMERELFMGKKQWNNLIAESCFFFLTQICKKLISRILNAH